MLKEISIEIIRKCPNNCLHCSSLSNKYCNEIMPLEKFKEVVIDAAYLGAQTICLSGGEPFLHQDIVEMTRFVHSKGLNCYIYTSGIVLNENICEAIPEDILFNVSRSTTKLIFNLEAAEEKIYDIIMGTKGCFKKVKQSIISANKFNIVTEIHFVPMKLNINQIEKIVNLSKMLGVSKVSFLRLVVHGRAQKNKEIIELSNEEYNCVKLKLKEIQEKSDLSIRIGVPLSDGSSCHKCEAANGKLNIRYDGVVFPCEVFKNHEFKHSLPNLYPMSIYEERLKVIYEQSKYLSFIRSFSKEFSKVNSLETCVGQELIKIEKNGDLNHE